MLHSLSTAPLGLAANTPQPRLSAPSPLPALHFGADSASFQNNDILQEPVFIVKGLTLRGKELLELISDCHAQDAYDFEFAWGECTERPLPFLKGRWINFEPEGTSLKHIHKKLKKGLVGESNKDFRTTAQNAINQLIQAGYVGSSEEPTQIITYKPFWKKSKKAVILSQEPRYYLTDSGKKALGGYRLHLLSGMAEYPPWNDHFHVMGAWFNAQTTEQVRQQVEDLHQRRESIFQEMTERHTWGPDRLRAEQELQAQEQEVLPQLRGTSWQYRMQYELGMESLGRLSRELMDDVSSFSQEPSPTLEHEWLAYLHDAVAFLRPFVEYEEKLNLNLGIPLPSGRRPFQEAQDEEA